MTPETPTPAAPGTLDERAALRTIRERRRRVWRSALLVVLVTLGMVVLLAVNRDEQDIRACGRRMERTRQELQRLRDAGQRLPLADPEKLAELVVAGMSEDDEARRQDSHVRTHTHYNVLFSARAGLAPEIGVCCCRRPHSRLLRPPGRHVIVFGAARGVFELRWMDEAEFARRAAALELWPPSAR